MATGDLTTLRRVRDYLGLATHDADNKLAALITASSAWVLTQLGRPVLSATYTETRDGDGGSSLILRRWPVTSVTSVTVDGIAIAARTTVTGDGYVLRDNTLELVGYVFTAGVQNVVVVYRAGFEVTESVTIPATPGPYTVTLSSPWQDAISATLVIAGTALTEVTGAPSSGRYAVSLDPVTGAATYTFNAAQQSLAATVVYGTIPQDIEQAVIEHVALRFRGADRLDAATISGGGESVSFMATGPSFAFIAGVLENYREPGFGT